MFEPLVIISKPNAKRRDFICGKWVDVKPEDVYVGSIEAKETKMFNQRKQAAMALKRIVTIRKCAETCFRLGYVARGKELVAEAKANIRVLAMYHDKFKPLPC